MSVLSGFIHYSDVEEVIKASVQERLAQHLEKASFDFDNLTSKINNTLFLLSSSPILDDFLESEREEISLKKPKVEHLFLRISKGQSKEIKSIHFFNSEGKEQIAVRGKRRIRNYTSLREVTQENALYQKKTILFEKLSSQPPGTILCEGPFKDLDGTFRFVVGMGKMEPEVGGFGGMITLLCDLSEYITLMSRLKLLGRSVIWIFYNKDKIMLSQSDQKVSDNPLPYLRSGKINDYKGFMLLIKKHLGSDKKELLTLVINASPEIFSSKLKGAVLKTSVTSIIVLGISILFAFILSRRLSKPIKELSGGAGLVASGRFDHEISVRAGGEIGDLAQSFNNMLKNLRQKTRENELQNWFKTGQAELNNRMRGEQDLATLSRNIVTFLADYLKAQIGAIYLSGDNNHLKLVGSYAFQKSKGLSNEFEYGEGLVGQAALEKESIILSKVPEDYIEVSSGLGEAVPRSILVKPFLYNGAVKGVVELGTLDEFSDVNLDFLDQVAENIAIGIHSAQSREKVQELLAETQKQAEGLQVQQEELRATNEELEEQTKALKESESRLQVQQEELQQTNEELEEQTKLLEEQKQNIQQKNLELEKTRTLIEEKASDTGSPKPIAPPSDLAA